MEKLIENNEKLVKKFIKIDKKCRKCIKHSEKIGEDDQKYQRNY